MPIPSTRALAFTCTLLAAGVGAQGTTALIPAGATWRYLDDGTDQGIAWRGSSFDDASWRSGPAPLGYGDGDEATVVSFGASAATKHLTTYFRHTFNVGQPGTIGRLCLRLLRDDGAVVFLNGTEVARSNLPRQVPVGYLTPAFGATDGPQENAFYDFGVDPAVLVAGANVISVELHQASLGSDDLSFDLELIASSGARCATQDNVLILIADDLGVDAVNVYAEGANPPPTPNIDALANRGVLFRNAWGNPTCSPSRTSIHTGRYGFRTGVGIAIPLQGAGVMELWETTLPEAIALGHGGYDQALFGKWHLGDRRNGGEFGPNLAGWDHFAGLLPGALQNYYSWPRTVNGVTNISTEYATSQIVDDALTWIGNQDGPWVCCVSFTAAHGPYQAPPQHLHSQNLTGLSPQQDPFPFFTAIVEAMDTEIGRLLASLGPELARTNVIFLGDNGTDGPVTKPPFASTRAKGTPYEGGVNVPLIAAGPAVRNGGREVGALVGLVDVFATVTELTGVDADAVIPPWQTLDSVSFLPYLASAGGPPQRTTVFSEQFGGDNWSRVNFSGFATVRNERYKLIRFYQGTQRIEELYDLRNDPMENQNLLLGSLTMPQNNNYQSLRQEIDRLRTPRGLYTFGETQCTGSNGKPTITGTGVPTIGASYEVGLSSGPPASVAVLLIGASRTELGGLSLPLPMQPGSGGPNCFLYTSTEFQTPATLNGSGGARVPFDIPDDAGLVGGRLFHTWLVWDPLAPNNNLGLTTSNALAAPIGI